MQHWKPILFGVALVAAAVIVAKKERGPVGQASVAAASAAPASSIEAPLASAEPEEDEPLAPAPEPERTVAADVPPLPSDAPKSVRFGVILVTYAGAQLAPKDAIGKDRAREKAKALLEDAKTSFEEAAKKGDPGSRADAGRIPRGVLEPGIEYALFTLKKGELCSEPVDTPRGFWVVKRTD